MSHILNITNGDCAVEIMQKAGLQGEFLPWRDVLHEGPVPQGLSLNELSQVRASFISGNGWGGDEEVKRSFIERDNALCSFHDYEKVILWFEHDLYDQLQLLQLLDWFHGLDLSNTSLSLICTEQYLGRLSPEEMTEMYQYEEPVTNLQLELGKRAWAAFRENSPEKWAALLQEDTSALPFLHGAVERMIQEFPSQLNGLSRTEQQALQIISHGEKRPGRIFGHNQQLEQRAFMGDSSFWDILYAFLDSSPALITIAKGKKLSLPTSPDQELSITSEGQQVLLGKRNWLNIRGLDRWIGGTHLQQDNAWCWSADNKIKLTRI